MMSGGGNTSSDDILNSSSSGNGSNHMPSDQLGEEPSTRAVYAFVSWIASISVYVIFLIWTLTPEDILHSLGITYYPNKHYALNLPVYALAGQ